MNAWMFFLVQMVTFNIGYWLGVCVGRADQRRMAARNRGNDG